MKQSIMLLLLTGLLAVILSGCEAKTAGLDTLLRHKFILKTADGQDFSGKGRPVDLAFSQNSAQDEVQVSGGVCNRFTGQGRLENGMLIVKNMASTKMFCADQDRNALETTFIRMLEQGAAFSLDDGILVLRQGGHELVYGVADQTR